MKQKVYVPVPVSERLPPEFETVCFIDKYDYPVHGYYCEIGSNKTFTLYGRCTYSISKDFDIEEGEITHWLEERELNVFTDEKLQTIIFNIYGIDK